MAIHAVLPGGYAIPLTVSPDWTIEKLIAMITKHIGIQAERILLMHNSEPLYGIFTVGDYEIKEGEKIFIGIWIGQNLAISKACSLA
ncbi:hypothetical protein TVAG_126230 [Trichomonas vaginalis G3]|uniref:Ubiquitin-like domain-containing protein n=1 Tax=Trichomonas vaginalis (strain ATCC PRA-98 / G3) TaxID=412133 RepID=A2ED11_TRIV3|nr:ubiquitin-like family [Trichomonas vaginalis G3]EAY09462.1 hypothetical protein TVAG_126230 [Trichomonas vaginalis G3]KAI5500643.1 ubiquitin-like family [Trichomonas vaginalis G3]|eukprot:XP_001321685.1 hypothetical protein [Trichomonas vaginalis G3]